MTDDLGGDKTQNPDPPLALPARTNLLEKQIRVQRWVVFVLVIAVSLTLFGTFFGAVFCSQRFYCYVQATPFAISIAVALLILPSLLLWSLVKAVFRAQEKPDDELNVFTFIEKVLSSAEKVRKILP